MFFGLVKDNYYFLLNGKFYTNFCIYNRITPSGFAICF